MHKRNLVDNVKNMFLMVLSMFFMNVCVGQVSADDIIGTWELKDKTSQMQIFKSNGKYFGKLLYGKEVVNQDGTSKKDSNNPDPKLRNQDLIGSTYIKDLVFEDDEWNEGKVYDSSTGKYWSCYVELEDGELHFTGYMGAKWLGKTYVYKRIVD